MAGALVTSGYTMTDASPWLLKPIQQPDQPVDLPIPPEGLTLGRDPHNDVVMSSPGTSGHHARVSYDGDKLIVADLGSKNGTLIRGKKIDRQLLRHGDVIQLGPDGPRFAVTLLSAVDNTVMVEAKPARRPIGDETMEFVRQEIGRERDAKVDGVVLAQKRNRSLIAMLVVVTLVIGGMLYGLLGQGDELVQKVSAQVTQSLEAKLDEARREIADTFLRFEHEIDAAHSDYVRSRHALESRRKQISAELDKIKSTESTAKDEFSRLRRELQSTQDKLKLYDPVNVEKRKLAKVAAFERAVVLIEVVESYRAKESGKLLFIETESDGSQRPNFESAGEPLDRRSTGSGFCFSKDGWILTNAHVVMKKDKEKSFSLGDKVTLIPEVEVQVVFSGQSLRHHAKVVRWSSDGEHDMALVKIEPFEGMPHVPQFDVNRERPVRGTEVFLLGFPLGKSVMQQGRTVIASTFRGIVSRPVRHFVQVDAVVHPGASGGPLIDGEGQVLGVVVGMHAANEDDLSSAIGYTLPISDAKFVWPPLPAGK